jgi:putative membrane protein
MRRAIGALALASTLALGACSTVGDTFGLMHAAPLATEHEGYTRLAAASDLFEIRSAQAALAKAQRPEVRAFAEMLLRDHSQSSLALIGAAQRDGWAPPSATLDASQQAMIDRLQNSGPQSADALFVSQQIAAHQRAYDLHRTYGITGDSPQLREFAAMVAPVIQQHLEAARRL